MKRMFLAVIALCLCCAIVPAQDIKELFQQRLGELKQSITQNQSQLRTYKWIETTELSLKGEVKNRSQKTCQFSPDGQMQKTPIGAPDEPQNTARGLKGRVIEKKVNEFQDYMDRFGSLVSRYVPPDVTRIQESVQSGKASLQETIGGNLYTLVFNDYAKPGDKVTFNIETSSKKLSSFSVATYLDGPEDAVGINARFASLDDGTNYVEETVLTSKSKQLNIKITNFGHSKAGL